MRYRYSFMIVLVLGVGSVMLQRAVAADPAAPSAQMNIDDLRARLALNAEQQAKIAPLLQERRSKLEAVRAKLSTATSRRDKRAVLQEAKSIQDDFNGKVEPLLTADQQTEWKKIREELRTQVMEQRRKRK